jgi:hypothetical protein
MPRSMGALAAAQLTSNYVRLAVFVQLTFASSTQYVWSGRGPINWNGQTWLGLGELGSISTITEDSTLTAQGLSISLSGIPTSNISEALTEVQQGLPVMIYVVFADQNGNPIDSIMSYAGRMDQPTIDESTETASIAISVENRLSDLQRAPFRRLTDQDQRLRFPTDDGFKYVNYLLDWNGAWGAN